MRPARGLGAGRGLVAAALLAGGLWCLWPGDAVATATCVAKRTPDGFVALRAAPSPSAPLLLKLEAGDFVVLRAERQGGWVSVQANPREGEFVVGWVRENLLTDCG